MATVSNGMYVTRIDVEIRAYNNTKLKSSSEVLTPDVNFMWDVVDRLCALLGKDAYIIDSERLVEGLTKVFNSRKNSFTSEYIEIGSRKEDWASYRISIKKI